MPMYRIDSQPLVFSLSMARAAWAFSGVSSSISRAKSIWLLIGLVSRSASVAAWVMTSALSGVPLPRP